MAGNVYGGGVSAPGERGVGNIGQQGQTGGLFITLLLQNWTVRHIRYRIYCHLERDGIAEATIRLGEEVIIDGIDIVSAISEQLIDECIRGGCVIGIAGYICRAGCTGPGKTG